ncbi:hypothetical protein Pcinc_025783 [Petrolisthes cinctipes]|uniref:Uncharacterized protein n=1 Tax=Petrolisthes cinctipes TaxID=88211 RepID=A0AAE1F7T3_PETCI|nr:hypothetical protein Pcinc_025783 [Petrolisthes cinctipes]
MEYSSSFSEQVLVETVSLASSLGGSHSTEQPGRPGGLILTPAMDDTDRIPIPEGKGMITDGEGQQTTFNTNDFDNTNDTDDLETSYVTDDLEDSANNIDHEASTNGNDSDIAVTNNDEDILTVNSSQETTIDRNDQQVTNADSYQQIMTADGGEQEEITPATTQNITTTEDIDSDVSEAVTTHTTSDQNLTTQIIQLADQTSEPLTSPSIIDEDLCSALGNLRLDSSAADDVSVEAASKSTAASGYTDSGFVVVETLDVSATVVAEDTQHQEDSCSSACDHDDDKDGDGSLTKDADSHTSERDSQDLVERDINIIPPHEVEINTLSSHSDQTPHTDELHLVVPGNTEPNSEGSGSQRRHSTPRASWLLLNMLGDTTDQQDEPRDQVQDVPETTPTQSQPEDISVPESAAETVSDPVGDESDPVLSNSVKTETENHMDGLEAEDVQKDTGSRVDECVSENDRIMNLRNTTDTQQMSGPAAGEELSPTAQTEQQEAQGNKGLPEAENVNVVSEDDAIGNVSDDGVKYETTELHVNEVHDSVLLSTPEEINSNQEQDYNDSTSASKFAGVGSEGHVASVTKETEVNVVINGGDIVHPVEEDVVSDKLSKLCVSESMEVSNVSEEVVCESKLVSEESIVKGAVVSELNMVSEMKEALVSEASVVSDVKQEIVSEESIVTKCDNVSEGYVASKLEESVSEKRSVTELKDEAVSEGSVVSEETNYRVTSEDKMMTEVNKEEVTNCGVQVVSNNVSEVKEETLSVVETVSAMVSDEKEKLVSEFKVVSEEFVSDINQELLSESKEVSEVKKETVSESKVVSEVKEEVVSESKVVSEVKEEVVAHVMQQMVSESKLVSEFEKEVVSEVKEEVMVESKSVSEVEKEVVSEVKEEVMEKVVAESKLVSESMVSAVKENVVAEEMVSEVKEKVVSEDKDEVVSEVIGEDVVSEVKGEEVVSEVNEEVVSEVKEVVSEVKKVVSEVKEEVVSDEVVSEVKEEVVSEVKEVMSDVKEVVSEVKEEVMSDSTTMACEVDKDLSVTQAAEKFVASVFEEAGMAMEKSLTNSTHTHDNNEEEEADEEEEKKNTTTTPMQEGKDEVGGVSVARVMSEESSGVKDGTEETEKVPEKVDTSQSEAPPPPATASEKAGGAAGGGDEEEKVQEAEEAIAYQPLAGKKSKKKCCIL